LKKRRLPVEEQNKAEQRDWEWKCDQCVVDVIRKKANYPENANKVPGLKCEGAACSNGLDIRRVDGLENSSCHFTYIVRFSFLTCFPGNRASALTWRIVTSCGGSLPPSVSCRFFEVTNTSKLTHILLIGA
jgi:hypothetical protein